MGERFWISKEAFLKIAEQSGLDTTPEHMNELYAFLRGLLPSLGDIEKLDLTGAEPFFPTYLQAGAGK